MTSIKTEYYFSKIAIVFASILLLIVLFLFAFVTYFLYSADLKIAASISFFFFLLFLTILPNFYKHFNFYLANTPALILTKDELIDNVNLQTFKWKDVRAITTASISMKARIRYIAIALIEPDKYIRLIKNPYKRFIARLNQKYFGGSFSIQPNIIKCNKTELLKNMTKYFEESK